MPGEKKAALQALISGRVLLEAAIMSDGCVGHDGLVDVGRDALFRME